MLATVMNGNGVGASQEELGAAVEVLLAVKWVTTSRAFPDLVLRVAA
jgi:hypothetical protein